MHSSQFRNAIPFRGKTVVVVGAGNSSIDICQDLAQGGAASVTMIQRSPVCVASRDIENIHIQSLFPLDVPIDAVDLKLASLPKGYITKMAMSEPVTNSANWSISRSVAAERGNGGPRARRNPGQGFSGSSSIVLHSRAVKHIPGSSTAMQGIAGNRILPSWERCLPRRRDGDG